MGIFHGVTVYRLNPEEVERQLSEKYGKKIMSVNSASLAKRKQWLEKWTSANNKSKANKLELPANGEV